MFDFHVAIGESVRFAKTVSESDVYGFAGISGDLSDVHCNEQFMRESVFGQRIAHGALSLGFMSTASTLMFNRHAEKYRPRTPVSLGYDRVRFLAPVFFGDTVTVVYTIDELDAQKHRSRAKVEARNQDGVLVASAQHLMKWAALEGPREGTAK